MKHEQDDDEGADDSDVTEDHTTFTKYDENNDGEITKEELTKYLGSVDDEATEGDVEVGLHHLFFHQTPF